MDTEDILIKKNGKLVAISSNPNKGRFSVMQSLKEIIPSDTDIHFILNKHFQNETVVRNHLINHLSLIEMLDTLSYNIKTIFDFPIADFKYIFLTL